MLDSVRKVEKMIIYVDFVPKKLVPGSGSGHGFQNYLEMDDQGRAVRQHKLPTDVDFTKQFCFYTGGHTYASDDHDSKWPVEVTGE